MTRKILADVDYIDKIFVSYLCITHVSRKFEDNPMKNEAMKNNVVSWRAFPIYIYVISHDRMFLRYRQGQAKDVNKSLLDLS